MIWYHIEVRHVLDMFWSLEYDKLNYNMHDKELLTIFKAFEIWYHYLEGLAFSINIVIKILSIFSTIKMLIQKQSQ